MEIIFKNNSLDVAANYDHFILDVWGVIHDGSSTYDGVIESLIELKRLKKKVCFLSNAPRRALKVALILEKFGIDQSLYDFIMTSGEAVYLYLQQNQQNAFSEYGKRYYYIGPDKDVDLLNGLKYEKSNLASNSDFALVTGFDHDNSTKDEKLSDLQECLKQNLTLICVNPDLIVVKKNGQEMLCAGVIAKQYEEMGGKVVYFGKPHNLIYETVLSASNITNKAKIIAIGDGIETDIKGANDNNIDSALIGGGILSNRLKISHGELPNVDDLLSVCKDYNSYPKFVLARL